MVPTLATTPTNTAVIMAKATRRMLGPLLQATQIARVTVPAIHIMGADIRVVVTVAAEDIRPNPSLLELSGNRAMMVCQ
jgi:hypothetical protein